MIPHPYPAVVLVLAIARVYRLVAYDHLAPLVKLREWLLHDRPFFAELVGCAFCLSVWLSIAAYVLWRLFPGPTMVGAYVAAASMGAGLIVKRWDA